VCKIFKNPIEHIESQVDVIIHIAKIIHTIWETCPCLRLQAAFRRGEFRGNASVEPVWIEFSESQLRNRKKFEESWRIDYVLEALSRRRQPMWYRTFKKRFLELFSIETSNAREFDVREIFDKSRRRQI
jgi:hypothetical protein